MHKQSSNSSCSSTTSGGKSSCSNYRDQGTKIGAKAPNPASIARKIITTQCLQHKKSKQPKPKFPTGLTLKRPIDP